MTASRETIGEAAFVAFLAMFLLHDRGFAWYRTTTGEAAGYDLDTPPGWFWWSMRNYGFGSTSEVREDGSSLGELLEYMAWKVDDRRSRAARWP